MNEAEWTVGEAAELARERREGFVLSPEFFLRAKPQTFISVTFATLFAMALYSVIHFRDVGNGTIFFAVAGFSLGSIPLARHWEKRQEARLEPEPEMRAAMGRDGRLVSLIVRQGDAPTGEDWGMLWIEDGRLYFAGRRTSFGLVPEQAQGFASLNEPAKGVRHRLNLLLTREGANGPMSLSFAPFVKPFWSPDVAVGALRMDLERWKNGRAYGEGQWPPSAIGPCVVSERRLLARALFATLFCPVFPALFFLAVSAPIVALVAFGSGMLVFSLAPGNALVWRAWRARRRMRRKGHGL